MVEHFKALSAIFPVFIKRDRNAAYVLLHRRQNTGYMDGCWDFAGSGHVEEGETATQALARECLEELAVTVRPRDAVFAHLCHRVGTADGRTYYDLYFRVEAFVGEPRAAEPEKCAELRWFPVESLPEDMIEIRRAAMENILAHVPYSEIPRRL